MILFILLALDLAGYADGDVPAKATAVIALVLAIVAVALEVRARGVS